MKMRNLLRTTLIALSFTLAYGFGYGQTTINFDDAGKWTAGSASITSYATDHVYSDGVFSATGGPALRQGTAAQDGFPGAFGTYSWRLRDASTVEWIATISSGGVADFSLKARRWDGSPSPDFNLDYSINGGSSWTTISTINNTSLENSSDWKTFGGTINSANTNILIRLKANGTTERIMVDDFAWTGYTPSGNQNPVISNITQNPAQLIQSSTTVSVSANVTDSDGTVEMVQLRWGKAADELENTISMTHQGGGVYTTASSIPAHYNGTTIYYTVYAEDNDGGSSLYSIQNYMVSPVISLETFDSSLGNYTTYSVAGGSHVWGHATASGNGFAQMNGHGSDTLEVDWLIMPSLNLSAQDLVLSFDTWKRYGVTDENNYLKLYYSTNYSGQGDPTEYTWTELPFTQPEANEVWVSSGLIDLSAIEGENVYIGFEYRYDVDKYVQWRVDNIKLEKKTYTVTFNVVNWTSPLSSPPVEGATVIFYEQYKQTDAEGKVTYNWVEPEVDLPFFGTAIGYHNTVGTLSVINKNITQQINLLDTRAAKNVSASPEPNNALISWVGQHAENYGIHYYEPGTQNEFYMTSTSSPRTISVNPSTTYLVRVRSRIDGNWSRYSPVYQFTTPAGTPVVATNVSVPDETVTSSSAVVNWTGSGAVSYGVFYYDVNSSASYYITASGSPVSISVLPETTYEVRVRTFTNGEWTSYTQPVRFITPEGQQVLATNVDVPPGSITSSTAVVTWDGSGADSYAVYYYDINSSAGYYITTSGSPVTLGVLPSTTYAVRVRTLVNGQWSQYTQPVTFTSGVGSQMLATTVVVSGETENSAIVSWNGLGAEAYGVYYYGGGNQYYRQTTASSINLTGLASGTNYAVRVRTRINGQWSGYTAPVGFMTEAGSKAAPLSNNSEDQELSLGLMLYPNPAKDFVNVRLFVDEINDVRIDVYDIRGALVKSEILHNQIGEVNSRIDLNRLNSGIYFVRISHKSSNEVIRLIVQ